MKCSCCGKELTLKEKIAYYKQRSEELREHSERTIERARKELTEKVDSAIERMHKILNQI